MPLRREDAVGTPVVAERGPVAAERVDGAPAPEAVPAAFPEMMAEGQAEVQSESETNANQTHGRESCVGTASCPRCEGPGDNHTETCCKRFDDTEAAEAEAAARAAPAPGVDIPPSLEAPLAVHQLHRWEAQT